MDIHEYDTDDDRMSRAEQLAGHDQGAATAEFRAIARDHGVDDDVRMEAASRLAEVDESAAADALRAIARDHGVDDDLRSEAADQLGELDGRATGRPASRVRADSTWRDRPAGPPRPPGPAMPPQRAQPPPVPWWVTVAAAGLERLRNI